MWQDPQNKIFYMFKKYILSDFTEVGKSIKCVYVLQIHSFIHSTNFAVTEAGVRPLSVCLPKINQ